MNLGILIDLHSIPDTTDFMILGYTVIFGVMGLYVLSLVRRKKNLILDIELLEEEDSSE